MKHHLKKLFNSLTLCLLTFALSTSLTFASTVNYTLDNIFQANGQKLTGHFQWDYSEGDFENGNGLFTELYLPGHGSNIDTLDITIDTGSIEFSLTLNTDNGGVGVNLFLDGVLSPTQAVNLDLSRSNYEIENGGKGLFLSRTIIPTTVPLPASAWLFISTLLGLIGFSRKQ